MNEAEFLARIRNRKSGDQNPKQSHPGNFPGPVRSLGKDLVAEFTTRLTAVGGSAYPVKDAAEARVALRDILHGRDLRRAALTGHPILRALEFDHLLQRMGLELIFTSDDNLVKDRGRAQAAIAQADVGLTGSEYGIAASGSLVMLAAPAHARSASLLPPIHIAVLRREQLLPDLAALSQRLQQDCHGRPPSSLVLITGPSRTADIEQTLSIGVHGPGEVHILLL